MILKANKGSSLQDLCFGRYWLLQKERSYGTRTKSHRGSIECGEEHSVGKEDYVLGRFDGETEESIFPVSGFIK